MTKGLVILGGARTAMAEYVGTPGFGKFKDVSAMELGARAIEGAILKSGIAKEEIDHVVMGNASQSSRYSIYGARHSSLYAGLSHTVPALTVNRICGSGLQSIITAGQMLLLDEATCVAAGGFESMSQSPHVLRGAREGLRFGPGAELQDLLFDSLMDPYCNFFMAQTAENLAKEYGITREAQDEFAYRSHAEGSKAVKAGKFAAEIHPVKVKRGKDEITIDQDDHIKPETTIEGLSKLRAAFGKDGTVTAGNASGIVDGGAAVIVTTADRAQAAGRKPLAIIRGWAISGVEPRIMGIGPVPAIQKVCEKTGVRRDQLDLIEINEAFAAQYLACEKALGLDRTKCNVNGGAVALGHPLGASGTRLVLTIARELRERGGRFGVASACIGGGQGIAILVENPEAK
ncbi:MAG: thiolase family protein [Planctomycetes bacterium]|nr:thiolase family protein [Planctomycetota bacterium]